jgi:RNA polymerase sigma factor (sigma-70 family)
MTPDTQIGGPSAKFPATRWSAVRAARSNDPVDRKRALETIIAAYWKPIYKYTRIRWGKSGEDAKDLTQEFFARLIKKNYLADFDPSKARLRTFLRVCIDHFVANEVKAAKRLKRGGAAEHISLDFALAESELARANVSLIISASPERIDEYLEKEYLRSLFGLAVEDLRKFCESHGKKTHFRLFEIYDLEDAGTKLPSYAELAAQFKIAVTDVTNHLAFARREFRRIALAKLHEMTTSEEEYRREARALLGVESK